MAGRGCLFSAPFSFLPSDTVDAYQALLPTTFREIWRREELARDESLGAWVMNPGQSFVVDDSVLDMFPGLAVLSSPSTGRNHIDLDACRRRGVAVYSLLDDRTTLESISASAEFTFLLLLNAFRRLDLAILEATSGRWRTREDEMRGRELAGKQVGIVGLGRIGRRVARYCKAFDASVAYFDPYVDSPDYPSWPLERIFADCNAVCVCPILSNETQHMIDYALLSRLKRDAVLVNTSRGEVVREDDLSRVLSERPDLRVAVDVITGEVTGTQYDSPLLRWIQTGQVVVSPHIAGATFESQTKAARGALNNLTRHFASAA